jgi:hypothetical protein
MLSRDVAVALGVRVGSLYDLVARGRLIPDGRAAGRLWWWPATVHRYRREHRPPATLSARQVADLLGVPLREVYRLPGLRPVGRFGNRPRWAVPDVLAYQAGLPPPGAVRTGEVAALLGVTGSRVRALAASTWPPDGRDHSGRLWWHRDRLDELLGPRRRAALLQQRRPS